MTALVRMRLIGFVQGGRVLAPLVALLAVLGILYGGGASDIGPGYGYSATMLFPILAWSTKLLLDTEPDVQRRLARVVVGGRREAVAGLLAALLAGLAVVLLAMIVPWPIGAFTTRGSLLGGLTLGALAHVVSLVTAVALGALSSRAVTGSVGKGLMVLVSGAVLTIVLGLKGSIAPWLMPPVMAMARALNGDTLPPLTQVGRLCAWAAVWCLAVLAGYAWLRRRRS